MLIPPQETHSTNVCSICLKTFSRNSNLQRHLLIHQNIKMFHCHQCGVKYSRREDLLVHSKKCVKNNVTCVGKSEKTDTRSNVQKQIEKQQDVWVDSQYEESKKVVEVGTNTEQAAGAIESRVLHGGKRKLQSLLKEMCPLHLLGHLANEISEIEKGGLEQWRKLNPKQKFEGEDVKIEQAAADNFILVRHEGHFDYLVQHDDHFHLHHALSQNTCEDHGFFAVPETRLPASHWLVHDDHIDMCTLNSKHDTDLDCKFGSPTLFSANPASCKLLCVELQNDPNHTGCFL